MHENFIKLMKKKCPLLHKPSYYCFLHTNSPLSPSPHPAFFSFSNRTHKYRGIETPGTKSQNPFSDRPTSSMTMSHLKSQIAQGLEELDKMSNAPDGVEKHVWERMCRLRRNKVESEQLVCINFLIEMKNKVLLYTCVFLLFTLLQLSFYLSN